jgi:cell filamentation protein
MREYECDWDSAYCYPESSVLINKLGILDEETLWEAERQLSSISILEILSKPIAGRFDFKHLRAIHKAIFKDIYPWAGNLRTVNISKGNLFCLPAHLEVYGNGIFEKLIFENYLESESQAALPEKLARYLCEINMLHPFREGNGRAQRVFIEYLARNSGLHAEFSKVSEAEMNEASSLSFSHEFGMMEDILRRITQPVSEDERCKFRKSVWKKGRPQPS